MTAPLPLQAVRVLLQVDGDEPIPMGLLVIETSECGVRRVSSLLGRLSEALAAFECGCPEHGRGVA